MFKTISKFSAIPKKNLSNYLINCRYRGMGKSKSKKINFDYHNMFDSGDEDFFLTGSYSYSTSAPAAQTIPTNYIKNQMREKERNTPLPQIKTRNAKQQEFLDMLNDTAYPIVVAVAPSGCGKTHLASVMGLHKLHDQTVQKIIITRATISADEEDLGFLPGGLEDKMDPWMRPIYDSFHTVYNPKKIQSMIEDKVIEICPLAYTRGRTFENAWIIGDECQNMTVGQMKMFLTRIGNNSKMIITGDLAQSDLKGLNGLEDLIRRLNTHGQEMTNIKQVHFGLDDIVRNPVIKNVLKLYKSP
jgi:phosphate starvation-inducible protein PhoH and related proteins